jgi:hypothetical protein
VQSPARPLAAALVLGTVLLGVAALAHPVLQGDAASHLRIIAAADHWRAVHLAMLACTGLVLVGIWVRLVVHTGAAAPLVAALALISIGLAIHSLNIVYMTGAGWQLATHFAAGDAGMAAIYDVTHPIGLMASRFGNFLVALGALALGWVEHRDPATPAYTAWLAWGAAAAGLAGVMIFHEASPGIFGAVAVLSLWQVVTGGRVLLGAQPVPRAT